MAHSIRVAMIIQRYYPHVGGAEQQLAALALQLQAQSVDVHILTRRYASLPRFEVVCGVPVHRLPAVGPKSVAALAFTLAALVRLRRLRPDVIHAHELLSPVTTAIAAKRLLGVPVVAKVLRGGRLGDLAKLKNRALGRRRIAACRQHVDRFLVISREIDAELADIGIPPERRVFLPNGVDTDRFAPPSFVEKQTRRAAWGLPDAPVVVFTGRLAPEKRVDQLIRSWPAVRAVYPDAHLLVIGTGSEESALRQIAGPGVRLTGAVEDVVPYLQVADLFVLPSATEGLSNALLEASAVGLPCLATRVGGASDLIEHGQSGWLVPPNDASALGDALLLILGDAALRAQLGRRGRERVLCDYALPSMARRLRSLYDQLTRSHLALATIRLTTRSGR